MFSLKTIYKKVSSFKSQKIFQCNNGFEFRSDATKFFEEHNADV